VSGVNGIHYSFRNISFDSIGGQKDVKSVVVEYSVLLFLRLYKLIGIGYGNPLFRPTLPNKQSEKRDWISGLEQFKRVLQNVLGQKETLKALDLDGIDDDFCAARNVKEPMLFIESLIVDVKASFEETKATAELDSEKLITLKKDVAERINTTLSELIRITPLKKLESERPNGVKDDTMVAPFRGVRVPLNREALVSDPSISHLNWDTIIGQMLVSQLYQQFAVVFAVAESKKHYRVPNGSILGGVRRLELEKDKHVLISFGVNIEYQSRHQGIQVSKGENGVDWLMDEIPIYCFDYGVPAFSNTMFAVRVDEVPHIWFDDWKKRSIGSEVDNEKYEKVDSVVDVYFSVEDFNGNHSLIEQFSSVNRPPESFENEVLISVELSGNCWLSPSSFLVQVSEGRMFQEGGRLDQLSSVKPFEELRSDFLK